MFSSLKINRSILLPLLPIPLFVAVWSLMRLSISSSLLLIPSLSHIGSEFVGRIELYFSAALVTAATSISGFLLGSFLAFTLGLLFERNRFVKEAFFPYAIALKTTPIVALAPIVVLWFGDSRFLAKVFIVSLMAFFPILVNWVTGLSTVEKEKVDLLKSFSANRDDILLSLRMPSALPALMAGLKIAAPLSVVGAFVADYIASDGGFGIVMRSAFHNTAYEVLYVSVAVLSLIGIIFYFAVEVVHRQFIEPRFG